VPAPSRINTTSHRLSPPFPKPYQSGLSSFHKPTILRRKTSSSNPTTLPITNNQQPTTNNQQPATNITKTTASFVSALLISMYLLKTLYLTKANVVCSRTIVWSRSCWGKCSIARCWKLGESWRASYSLGCHHLLQTLVSLVQRKVPDSSLLVTGGKPEGIVLSRAVIICCKRWSRPRTPN
jgi:hypothetical protein